MSSSSSEIQFDSSQPSLVDPSTSKHVALYVTSRDIASRVEDRLQVHNIGTVVNVSDTDTPKEIQAQYATATPPIRYFFFPMDDDLFQRIDEIGARIFALAQINSSADDGRGILLHCRSGISRSPAVAAVVMLHRHYPRMDAASVMAHIQTVRPIAEPNDNFREQLDRLCKTL